MRSLALTLILAFAAGCSATAAPSASPVTSPVAAPPGSQVPASHRATFGWLATPRPGMARLEPDDGAWFGLNLDWNNDSPGAAATRLGRMPAVWVQFARFPLDEGSRDALDTFVAEVSAVGGLALITLEPHDGLANVTDAAAAELADLLAGYWANSGVPTFVRFAHEMNGSWYSWGQDPATYVDAFRRVAAAVHERSPASAMVWAPNEGAGYPFPAGKHRAAPGSPAEAALDTDGDGALTAADDPYAPYYPGDDAVDWVGMSLYHWGREYPWGENELPLPGTFGALLSGRVGDGPGAGTAARDFYATYAVGREKPLAIVETAILFDAAAPDEPTEAELKSAWFKQVFGEGTRDAFPRIGMLNWFEWRKEETEVGRVIDWRLATDPALAQDLLDSTPPGWLRFAGD